MPTTKSMPSISTVATLTLEAFKSILSLSESKTIPTLFFVISWAFVPSEYKAPSLLSPILIDPVVLIPEPLTTLILPSTLTVPVNF